jgi:hypothetical protein
VDATPIREPTQTEVEHEAAEMQMIESICTAAVRLPKALPHGQRYLDPGGYRRLRVAADLINQLSR